MFVRGLIAIGMSLALLAGSAAGQSLCHITHFGLSAERNPWILHECNGPSGWPDENWPHGELHPEHPLQAFIDDAMSREVADVMGESRQIVVIHKGRLVAEAYRDGLTPETKLVSWSMAKSITHALVGRAVMSGLIEDIDAPMPGPWAEGDPRAAVSWRQWMMMVDGLDYHEVDEPDIAKNDVVQMMFGPGRFDVVDYAAGLEQVHPVGTHWNYSTAAYHLISQALSDPRLIEDWWKRRLAVASDTGETDPIVITENSGSPPYCKAVFQNFTETLEDYIRVKAEPTKAELESFNVASNKCVQVSTIQNVLFTPLGMDAQPEFDASGTFLGGSLVYASARDFARFGYLYLRDGVWDGERLLPEGWVDFARRPHEGTGSNVYGAGWWITPPEGETPTHPQSAISAPYDAYHAGGNEGQTIWVVPSKDLVIVRLGLMSNAPENWAALYEWNQKVARAFPDVE